MFRGDFTDVPESGVFEPFPPGEYELKVLEVVPTKTKKGDPRVRIKFMVDAGLHKGKTMWDGVVLFPPKQPDGSPTPGAGIIKHFLHCIGEPYEGQVVVNPENWKGKTVWAQVMIESYQGKENNRIDQYHLYGKTEDLHPDF